MEIKDVVKLRRTIVGLEIGLNQFLQELLCDLALVLWFRFQMHSNYYKSEVTLHLTPF